MLNKVCFLTICALFIVQSSALPSRIKRQGFGWNDIEDASNNRPQSQFSQPQFSQPQFSQPQFSQTQSTPSSSGGGTTTTTPSPQFSSCVSRCPVTPEYNPVCGTDRVTYNNESRMRCAQRCGLNVQKAFGGTCSPLR